MRRPLRLLPVRRITDVNHFYVRLTNMVRSIDPTSKVVLAHYQKHYEPGNPDALASLILNIMFVRNTMSKEVVKLCEQGKLPWLRLDHGKVGEASKKAAAGVYLGLQGKVFFTHVEPMKSRSKCPRRGWGELVSEVVAFARKAQDLAAAWQGENAVETFATQIRQISGFGSKESLPEKCGAGLQKRNGAFPFQGFRMKEILLDG